MKLAGKCNADTANQLLRKWVTARVQIIRGFEGGLNPQIKV